MDSSLKKDLGLDSLDRLVLILDVEREFGIKLLDEHVKHIQTLRDLEGFITAYVSRNNSNHYRSFPTDYFYIS
jgi:acyl carrier protein